MFARKLSVRYVKGGRGEEQPCPLAWIDNFAMRNFTNDAIFDDTLPAGDGVLEAGYRVPLPALEKAIDTWFRRKGYFKPDDVLRVEELPGTSRAYAEAGQENGDGTVTLPGVSPRD